MKTLKANCYLSINFLLLKVSQSFGSNSLLLEFQDEMEITKNFRLGYCTLKGINQLPIGIASSIRQGSHELDFHRPDILL